MEMKIKKMLYKLMNNELYVKTKLDAKRNLAKI